MTVSNTKDLQTFILKAASTVVGSLEEDVRVEEQGEEERIKEQEVEEVKVEERKEENKTPRCRGGNMVGRR